MLCHILSEPTKVRFVLNQLSAISGWTALSVLTHILIQRLHSLELKSPSALSEDPGSSRQYVNLCTPSKTYRIRQVQSSNSIHIMKPTTQTQFQSKEKTTQDSEMTDDHDRFDVGGMTAIAKCGSTLELHIPPEGFSAVPFLQQNLLRVYDRLSSEGDFDLGEDDGDDDMDTSGMGSGGGDVNTRVGRLKNALFTDIPVSRGQCESAWVEVCAFTHQEKDNARQSTTSTMQTEWTCWRPSALVKLDVWKRVLEGAVLQSIDLQKQFLVKDLWKAMLDDLYDDGSKAPFPRALFDAVLKRVCDLESNKNGSEFKCGSSPTWTSLAFRV